MQPEINLKKLGRYEIIAKIGEGGMGTVFEAIDPILERKVALKVAKISSGAETGSQQNRMERFLKEARLAAQFIHPNIAITYDAGIEEGLLYMAIELVDGKGLQAHARVQQLLPVTQVLEIIYNVCYALDYIHTKGYLHLDIKPSNIMLTQKGEAKLMDFGISRLQKESSTPGGKISGTLYYLSPEQVVSGQPLNQQTDLFALGTVLYELLSGFRPFEGDDPYQIIYKISHEAPLPISSHLPEISPEIAAVVNKALSKDRKNRFQSAREFADVLLPIIRGKDSVTMDRQDQRKMAFLRQLYLFRHFQLADLKEIIRLSAWKAYKKDTWIIEKSDGVSYIYFIIHGSASLWLGGEKKLLRKGEVVGESAVLYPTAGDAKIRAESDCVVMIMNAAILNQAGSALQVKLLKEFYNKKVRQLVEANLKIIRARG
jgi:eukaryotic-like serine/threonine-protein kinase